MRGAICIVVYRVRDHSENDCAENVPGKCVSCSTRMVVSGTSEIWHSSIFISFLLVPRLFPRCGPRPVLSLSVDRQNRFPRAMLQW